MKNGTFGVIVSNRLGQNGKSSIIGIKKNDRRAVHCELHPGQSVMLSGDRDPLQSLELESIGAPIVDYRGNIPISITLDSPQDYPISVIHNEDQRKLRLKFRGLGSPKAPEGGSPKSPPGPVNVTLGREEPPVRVLGRFVGRKTLARFFIAFIPVTILTWFLSPFLLKISLVSWIAIPMASLVGGFVYWFRSWRKNKKKA